jgi:hypothetical protein
MPFALVLTTQNVPDAHSPPASAGLHAMSEHGSGAVGG